MSQSNAKARSVFPAYKLSTLAIIVGAALCAGYGFQLGLGTLSQPGPGLWPTIVASGMAVAALMLFVSEKDAGDYESFTKRTWIIAGGFGLMVLFIVLFIFAGFTVATLTLSVIWLRWMAKERWVFVWGYSIGQTVLFVLIFSVLLGVPMPYDVVLALLTGRG